ncbi:hypothetical protein ES704_02317 [subsurface metagenome]|jgi:GTPase SAR1 family protein
MNQKIESLTDGQIAKLVGFLKKINYPQEELKYAIKKKLNKSTLVKNDNFDNSIKLEDLIRLGIQEIDFEWLISQISMDVFTLFEKSISRGQVKAIIKRVLGVILSSTDRSQLYEMRKKIRKSEKFLTYFGEWGKEPGYLFKVIITGLDDDQSRKLHSLHIAPKMSGERITIGVEFYTKTIESYNKSLIKLQFWNISGNKRFEFLRERYYKGASAMIIFYEKGNQESLKSAKKYYSEFKKATNLKFKLIKLKDVYIDTPIILVGLGGKSLIPLEGGPYLAKDLGATYFDKNEIRRGEFEEIFNYVSVELVVKCQNPKK